MLGRRAYQAWPTRYLLLKEAIMDTDNTAPAHSLFPIRQNRTITGSFGGIHFGRGLLHKINNIDSLSRDMLQPNRHTWQYQGDMCKAMQAKR